MGYIVNTEQAAAPAPNPQLPGQEGGEAGPATAPIYSPDLSAQDRNLGNDNLQELFHPGANNNGLYSQGPIAAGNNPVIIPQVANTTTPEQLQGNLGSTAGPVASSSSNTTATATKDNDRASVYPTEETGDND